MAILDEVSNTIWGDIRASMVRWRLNARHGGLTEGQETV